MTIGKHWPLVAALILLYAALGVCLIVSMDRNDGHFVYVLDDPYIHMAVAKNLAEHGVFGVTRHGFSAATSSIGWPLLLWPLYLLLGPNAVVPLVLNVGCATAVVCVVYLLLREQEFPPGLNFLCLLAFFFCIPLPAIVFTGMEHTLHVLLAVMFLYLAARSLVEDGSGRLRASLGSELQFSIFGSPRTTKLLYYSLPPLITMTRYEGAFMVAVVCLLLALRRRLLQAAVLGTLGALPVIVNGLISLSKGWHFLPNSVLLKGRMPSGSSLDQVLNWFRATGIMLIQQPHVPALGIATLL